MNQIPPRSNFLNIESPRQQSILSKHSKTKSKKETKQLVDVAIKNKLLKYKYKGDSIINPAKAISNIEPHFSF